MAWTRSDIPDLTGRVAVVTGANAGLGLETARALAGAGAHVVMAARDQEKAAQAEADIKASEEGASLAIVPMDLGSLASVGSGAEAILSGHDRIDILVNNAGVMATPERTTEDGFELQFGVNHLGHFALTSKLLPALLNADAARVVSVTSTAHHMGRAVNPANPHLKGSYGAWKAYGQSKLANFHFGIGLQRKFEEAGTGAKSFIAHPGLSNTDLQAASVRNTDGGTSQKFFHVLAGRTGMTPAQGAMPQIRAATDPSARGGEFYAPRFVNNGPAVKRPILGRMGLSNAIQTLWEVSEKETGVTLDVAAAAGV
jgi:NAD(P)-dependent dehydrogenase (short-subunit alcohol dehydrogenase family)